jgi:uncharacterized membrane protein YuzA (DUF378 family)
MKNKARKDELMKSLYIDIYSRKFLILGALNYLVYVILNVNLIDFVGHYTNRIISLLLYTIIGLAGLYQLNRRDFYLSFLDKSVYPCGSLMEKKPNEANMKKKIKTKPNINIIYWASEYNDTIFEDPYLAYNKYSNTGVVKSDSDGNAVLEFRKPQGYKVPYKNKILKPHIHYRECFYDGMVDSVKTIFL